MTPTITHHRLVEQRTGTWDDLRRGIATASAMGRLLTPTGRVAANEDSRAIALLLASERITGWTVPTYQSTDMLRGVLDEPLARELYAEHYAPVEECGFITYDLDGWRIGFSPDGMVGDDGLIEIKSRVPKVHLAHILADRMPDECMAQVQTGLLVSGREWCDYVSYCSGMPLWVKRIYPDPKWHESILAGVVLLEQAIASHIATYRDAVAGLVQTERVDHFAEIEV